MYKFIKYLNILTSMALTNMQNFPILNSASGMLLSGKQIIEFYSF